MTDKQIRDKVNVKECKYYCNGKCERYEEFVEADYANYSVKCICEEENTLGTYDICDYRQLTCKEQECEESKNKIEFMEGYIKTVEKARNEVEQQLDQLKAENELLKINNAQFIKDNEFLAKRNSKLKAENDLYKNAHKTEQDRRRSYENALAEIKEIAKIEYPKSLFTETFVEVINHCPYFDCGNCKCLENKEKQNCGGFICSRKQSVYYQENTIYFKQILKKNQRGGK